MLDYTVYFWDTFKPDPIQRLFFQPQTFRPSNVSYVIFEGKRVSTKFGNQKT